MSAATVLRLERPHTPHGAKLETAKKLAQALGVTVADLTSTLSEVTPATLLDYLRAEQQRVAEDDAVFRKRLGIRGDWAAIRGGTAKFRRDDLGRVLKNFPETGVYILRDLREAATIPA